MLSEAEIARRLPRISVKVVRPDESPTGTSDPLGRPGIGGPVPGPTIQCKRCSGHVPQASQCVGIASRIGVVSELRELGEMLASRRRAPAGAGGHGG